jgi:hypothetical protein
VSTGFALAMLAVIISLGVVFMSVFASTGSASKKRDGGNSDGGDGGIITSNTNSFYDTGATGAVANGDSQDPSSGGDFGGAGASGDWSGGESSDGGSSGGDGGGDGGGGGGD